MEAHPVRGVAQALTSPKPMPNPKVMDYEEEQEQYEEVQAEQQAEAMEIDEDDAPYLDLRDAHEWQGCAILKNWSFVHTWAFDLELLIKIGMDEYFCNVWHAIGWDCFVPIEYGSRLLTIQFLCTFLGGGKWGLFSIFQERIFVFLENFCWPPWFQQALDNFSWTSLPQF